jgi:tetratricopeptide (TPR) repeat protein
LQRVRSELLPHIDIRVIPVEPQALRYLHLRYRLRCADVKDAAEAQTLRQRLHQAVAEAGPPGTELALDLARADLRADDLAAAQARLEALVQATPESGEGRLLLAQTLRSRAELKDKPLDAEAQRAALERAAEHLVQAQRLLPDSARARHEQAQVLMALGRPTEALVAARAARQCQPSNWGYSLLESKLALQAGNRQAAVDALELFAYQTWWPDHAKTARTLIAAAVAGKPATDLLNLLKADEPATNTKTPKP